MNKLFLVFLISQSLQSCTSIKQVNNKTKEKLSTKDYMALQVWGEIEKCTTNGKCTKYTSKKREYNSKFKFQKSGKVNGHIYTIEDSLKIADQNFNYKINLIQKDNLPYCHVYIMMRPNQKIKKNGKVKTLKLDRCDNFKELTLLDQSYKTDKAGIKFSKLTIRNTDNSARP